jgi:hypothetical protein
MPIATDTQMQTFANERLRPFAELFRNIIDGQGTDATNAAALRSAWAVLNTACVRKLV